MASFSSTYKPLQLHLSNFSLNTFPFHHSSPSPSKLPLITPPNVRLAARPETALSLDSARDADFLSGLSSFSDTTKRADTGKKPAERRVILKDRYSNSKRRKDGNLRGPKEGGVRNGDNVEQKEKRIKKSKADQPGNMLRIGLDSCSKMGDVVAAIKLYDLARKEGIPIGQYHYAVLLYLCSSAAAGVVQPAKSGTRGRSLSSGDRESSQSLSDIVEMVNCRGGFSDEDLSSCVDGSRDVSGLSLDSLVQSMRKAAENSNSTSDEIQVSEDMKRVALEKGFEIYKEMGLEKVPMNEATFTSVARMAMALGDGEMAFDIVKQMKEYGINPRLRSYGPALAIFCNNGDVENAFEVEKHMLENGVYPEEPELEALLRASIEAGKSDKVYYILHKLRTSVRQVSPSTADSIEKWFTSKVASRVGKRKWDQELIMQAMENGGGGWHGSGWLGKGKWRVSRSRVGSDGICKCCGEKLVTIDLDPIETENFAKSVASIAAQRERNSSFEKFQKWLDYYGPFEAVVDAANVGLYSQRKFKPSKVNLVVNGIRQMLPSKKFPLIVLHNRRITGEKMDEPFNRSLIDKWRNADALYATPTGSNDDWYWLYAAIKCRCLLVTNDEMRDHLFQLLGNDFFPKWKERHQVRFTFAESGPVFRMPPPCSVVIQETEKGHWHVPIASEVENEDERIWLCCSRGNSSLNNQDSSHLQKEAQISRQQMGTRNLVESLLTGKRKHEPSSNAALTKNHASVVRLLEAAEQRGACPIDFQI
ncbi:proteinaceous RNase P 1, chloroplastic/mitochondrial-like [Salvia miltiorrhiza]|uniref:proteinaceous RNase P 1, chloroplastic/mitochondrial-like n=1 Tax=Salvia miltiorrhiza TaxID=226208 RepID=UPI0025ACA6A7|nr:proteinaceous RNase P 1, chloroplastic/mitochondrial-like [Salvia miltiorrhiza]